MTLAIGLAVCLLATVGLARLLTLVTRGIARKLGGMKQSYLQWRHKRNKPTPHDLATQALKLAMLSIEAQESNQKRWFQAGIKMGLDQAAQNQGRKRNP